MNRTDAESLYRVYRQALKVISDAEAVLFDGSDDPDRVPLRKVHLDVLAAISFELRHPLVTMYPDLDLEDRQKPDGPPDTALSDAENERVSKLTFEDIRAIDQAILADCASSWRKVARVVGTAMQEVSTPLRDVPSGYFALRVASLVDDGQLESQGNLDYMRFSEIRLPLSAMRDPSEEG